MKPKENKYYISYEAYGFRMYYLTKVVDNPNYEKELDRSSFGKAFKYHIDGIALCGFNFSGNGDAVWWGDKFEWDEGYGDIEVLMYNEPEDYNICEEFGFSKEEKKELFNRMFNDD